MTDNDTDPIDVDPINTAPTDSDRLTLLDRLAERIPDLDLSVHTVAWMRLPDGHEALLVDGGGIDGGDGVYFANAPNGDVHAVGSTSALFPGTVGCVVIKPDGSRYLARVEADPLAPEQPPPLDAPPPG
jgi:hypothetical protein